MTIARPVMPGRYCSRGSTTYSRYSASSVAARYALLSSTRLWLCARFSRAWASPTLPPLWEMADAAPTECGPQAQLAPDYEFDQRIAW
jgi:hypothetical protein